LKSDRMPSSANARSTLKSRVRRPGEYTQCLSRKEKDAILSAFKQFESDHADLLTKAGGKVTEWHRDNELTSGNIEAHLRGESTTSDPAAPPASSCSLSRCVWSVISLFLAWSQLVK
jgi:hypothetical protein